MRIGAVRPTVRVIVCGGLDYGIHDYHPSEERALLQKRRRDWIDANLDRLNIERGPFAIVSTEPTTGAPAIAGTWAKEHNIAYHLAHGNSAKFGTVAPRMRRTSMLNSIAPDLVIAFPGGDETLDMVTKARARGIEVIEIGDVE